MSRLVNDVTNHRLIPSNAKTAEQQAGKAQDHSNHFIPTPNTNISIGPGWETNDWMLDIYGSPEEGLRLFFDDLGQLQDLNGRLSKQIEAMVKELYGL